MPKKPSLRYHKRAVNRYSAGMQKIDAQQTEEALSDLLYTQLFYYSLLLSLFSAFIMPRVSMRGVCRNGKHCQDSNCRLKHTCPHEDRCHHRIDNKCTWIHDPVDPNNIPPCIRGDRCKHKSDGKCGNGSHSPEASQHPPQQMMMVNMAPQLAWPHPPFFPQQPCVPHSHDGPMVLPNGLHVWHARG